MVVVEWLFHSKRIIMVRSADLSEFLCSSIFVGEMCVFASRPIEIVSLSSEKQ